MDEEEAERGAEIKKKEVPFSSETKRVLKEKSVEMVKNKTWKMREVGVVEKITL